MLRLAEMMCHSPVAARAAAALRPRPEDEPVIRTVFLPSAAAVIVVADLEAAATTPAFKMCIEVVRGNDISSTSPMLLS